MFNSIATECCIEAHDLMKLAQTYLFDHPEAVELRRRAHALELAGMLILHTREARQRDLIETLAPPVHTPLPVKKTKANK